MDTGLSAVLKLKVENRIECEVVPLKDINVSKNVNSFIAAKNYSKSLISITIPEGVTTSDKLANLKLSNKLKTIENWAFGYCHSLKVLDIAPGIENIEESAFHNCDNLELVSIPKEIEDKCLVAFKDCKKVNVVLKK